MRSPRFAYKEDASQPEIVEVLAKHAFPLSNDLVRPINHSPSSLIGAEMSLKQNGVGVKDPSSLIGAGMCHWKWGRLLIRIYILVCSENHHSRGIITWGGVLESLLIDWLKDLPLTLPGLSHCSPCLPSCIRRSFLWMGGRCMTPWQSTRDR